MTFKLLKNYILNYVKYLTKNYIVVENVIENPQMIYDYIHFKKKIVYLI